MSEKGVPASKFKDKKTIISVNFGEDCVYVEESAFEGCESLTKINDDNKIKRIGSRAFANCTNLSDIKLSNCEYILHSAFEGCESLTKINDRNKIKEIGSKAFANCTNLTVLTLPNCEKIYYSSFDGCKKLKKIYLLNEQYCNLIPFEEKDDNKQNKKILFYVYSNLIERYTKDDNWKNSKYNIIPIVEEQNYIYKSSNNKIIEIKNTENIIKNEYSSDFDFGTIEFDYTIENINKIFKGNEYLIYIDLPSKSTRIVESAFEGCTNLQNITLSDTLKIIEDYAFKNCKSLTSFIIPNKVEELEEGIFTGCDNLNTIEGSFTTYNNNAVVYNNKLICVLPKNDKKTHKISDIDKNIKRLGKYCFYGCKNMTSVYIPSNILSIGNYAFAECENLTEVYFDGEPPILGINVFGNIKNKELKIYVPKNRLNLYKLLYENDGYSDIICAKP